MKRSNETSQLPHRFGGSPEFTWSSEMIKTCLEAFGEACLGPPEVLLRVLWEVLQDRPLDQNVFNLLEAVSIGARAAGFRLNDLDHETTQVVDALGRVIESTDPNGVVTGAVFDILGPTSGCRYQFSRELLANDGALLERRSIAFWCG